MNRRASNTAVRKKMMTMPITTDAFYTYENTQCRKKVHPWTLYNKNVKSERI